MSNIYKKDRQRLSNHTISYQKTQDRTLEEKTQDIWKSKENKDLFPKKRSYVEFLTTKNQTNYPFTSSEVRFQWQNLNNDKYSYIPNNLNKKKMVYHQIGKLEKGIGHFFAKNVSRNNKFSSRNKSVEYKYKNKFNSSFERTRRVLLPEYDYSTKTVSSKKMYYSMDKYKYNIVKSEGNITSLFNKAPLPDLKLGKKYYEKTNKNTLNLFGEEYKKLPPFKSNKKLFMNIKK